MKRNRKTKIVIWSIIMLLAAIFIGNQIWNSQFSPVDSKNTTPKAFVVNSGESVSSIATRLSEQNIIKSDMALKIYLKQYNLGGKIQAGTFNLAPSMNISEIAKTLTENPTDKGVTLLEGWRVEEMAEKLEADLGIKKADFLKVAKEGYMFPDTYQFQKDVTAQAVAQKLTEQFNLKYTDAIKSKIRALGLTEAEGVILASIVEREARSDEVRTNVAGILLKRLNIGMALNVDATIQYILGYQPAEKSWWKRNLTHDDLQVLSAYNTYLHNGLPPAPICNPSLSSLMAVANANPKTPYLYYYHDLEGNTYYAKTLEEHNQNVANHR